MIKRGPDYALNRVRQFSESVMWAPGEQLDALTLVMALTHVKFISPNVPYVLATGEAESGKGHPHGTGILTPGGFTPVETLVPGDLVIGSNGQPVKVLDTYRRGMLPVYRVTFNDGSSVLVDEEHRWATRDKNGAARRRPFASLSTYELNGRVRAGERWEIPQVSSPVEFPRQDLPVDPYVLGVLLGDGTVYDNGSARFDCGDEKTPAEVAQRLPAPYSLRKSGSGWAITRGTAYKRVPSPFGESLKKLSQAGSRSGDKSVPDLYLYASAEQRLDLLRGLMDTDGHWYKNEHGMTLGFASASEALCDQVRFLAESFGGVARKRVKCAPKFTHNGEVRTGQDSYELVINIGINPFLTREGWVPHPHKHPKRIINSIEPEGKAEVTCLRVDADDALYLTEHCIVTHNSTLTKDLPLLFVSRPFIIDRLTTSDGLRNKFLERFPPDTFIYDDASKIWGASGRGSGTTGVTQLAVNGYADTGRVAVSRNGSTVEAPAWGVSFFNGLGDVLPGDVATRCIKFPTTAKPEGVRKRPANSVPVRLEAEPLKKELHRWATSQRRQMAAWLIDNGQRIHPLLDNRLLQLWGPLFAVAHAAGGSWPGKCLSAFLALGLDESPRPVTQRDEQALLDTATVAMKTGASILFTADLVPELRKLDPYYRKNPTDYLIGDLLVQALGPAQNLLGTALNGKRVQGEGWRTVPVLRAAAQLKKDLRPPQASTGPDAVQRAMTLTEVTP